ncbi:MAG: RluA family pseudouridine synthase [Oscillospiraceae bacterium]|jgi:23S rRNA pseudouridine1911/1915/1917 synthase|nr:RluA family pseudouridine synthase [Oscillospiraceae bacterium]
MTSAITASDKDGGARLDVFLARTLPNLSRSSAARLIETGRVTIGGRAAAKNRRVLPGETFEIDMPPPEVSEASAQDIPLDVRYEDSDLIVINKPRGLVVHPAPGHPDGTVVNALLRLCGDSLSGVGGKMRPGIVHRLDKDTSGLLIAAKNDFSHLHLSSQLAARTLSRTYETVARGALPQDAGIIDAPTGRHPTNRLRQAVLPRGGRHAVTRYEVIERFPGYTYARAKLETGRTHQIRVHFAHIGHPVLGDGLYGGGDRRLGLSGQCLHAVRLSFIHPRSGETVTLEAERPDYFEEILKKLRNM